MENNQDINYALITALYASQTHGLYSDVYFPIIKYSISQLYQQKSLSDRSPYFLSQDVHDFINERFKIKIPSIVIGKSIQKIAASSNGLIDIRIMENGESFQIKKMWDSSEFDTLGERESFFTNGLAEIETDYKLFLQKNGSYDDGVSFLQFISDNTDQVLGYFQNNDVSVIDEKYVTIVFFLEYLHRTPSKEREFRIANQLFWASIIAGFLRSEKPPVDASEDGQIKEYFLDTSILMGLLNLSSRHKERYASEICEIIKSSGGVMKVHPMTVEEIKSILASVENAMSPDPGTDIAEAWINHKLTLTKLASIRLSVSSMLDKLGIKMFPVLGPNECRRIVSTYKGKKIVEELARNRYKAQSNNQDSFREIHDLYLDDFIKDRRKEKNTEEDVVFVTANYDLISFTEQMHPGQVYMVSTGKIVLDLWMHNVKPANISSCALTETMARCLDQHNVRVKAKIMEVSRFFNENKGNFDSKVYQDFIKKLYRRAKNVIMTVESVPDSQDPQHILTAQRILDAVKADQDYTDKQREEAEERYTALAGQISEKNEHPEGGPTEVDILRGDLDSLAKKNSELSSLVETVQNDLSQSKQRVVEEKTGRSLAERKVALYKRKDEINKELAILNSELIPLLTRRELSFHDSKRKWLQGIGILFILSAIGLVIWFLCIKFYYGFAIGAILVTIGGIFINKSDKMKDTLENRRNEAFRKWESDPLNTEYSVKITRREELEQKIQEIEKELSK